MVTHLPVYHFHEQAVTMNLVLLSFFMFCYFTLNTSAQQGYFGNQVLDCNNTDDSGPSPTFLYTCNSEESSCRAFMIFKSQSPYNTVLTISKLISADPSELALVNNVSSLSVFPTGKEVIVPVNCSCSGQFYQANSSYVIPSEYDTYFTIANDTYQGLSTCDSLIDENTYSEMSLLPGLELRVPLRCACPTSNQTAMGTKYLLTYSVFWGDDIANIGERFNVSRNDILGANTFSEDDPTVYPFTTILIPFPVEPSSSKTITQVTETATPYTPLNPGKQKSKKGLHLGVGISVSSLVAVCVILVIALLCHRKKLNAKRKRKGVLPEDLLLGIAMADRVLKVFVFEDIKAATNNFDSVSKIKGSVYRGVLGGEVVVIKKVKNDLWKEVRILQKINHFNLIRLYGVCEDSGYSYLVYEYMENGCLSNWLGNKNHPAVKSWSPRIQIALDIANGIHYLHNFTDPAYVHKDIKSSNILLDRNLRAKIANFGRATATEGKVDGFFSSKFVGTRGYMAPEYLETGLITPKIDVYAFGVVMLELITGKNGVMMHHGKELLLSATIISIMEGENIGEQLYEFLDPSLTVYRMDLAVPVAKLSVACLKRDPSSRPTMDVVVSSLVRLQRDCEMI